MVAPVAACGTSGSSPTPTPPPTPPHDAAPRALTAVPAHVDPPLEAGPPHPTQLAVGSNHACARMSDDTLRCWGSNDWGQLGDGTVLANPLVVTPALAGVVEVSAGYGFTCARLRDRTVRCFGNALAGEIGVPSPTEPERNHSIPTPTEVPGLTDAVQLGSTHKHTCAVRADGTVVCWGDDSRGELGDGQRRAIVGPVQVVGLDGVTQLGIGPFTCARRVDGTAWCWGLDRSLRAAPLPGVAGVAEVAMGYLVGCVRGDAGAVRCWGSNDSGQLGRDGDEGVPAPVEGLVAARAVAVGATHACAIVGDEVQCWGAASINPGFATSCLTVTAHAGGGGGAPAQWEYCATPTAVPGVEAPIAIASSDRRMCALTRAHEVLCWGDFGEDQPTRAPL